MENVIDLPAATGEKGAFNFTCTPDVSGNWAVTARWQSDRGHYSSAYSENMPIEVAAPLTPPSSSPKRGISWSVNWKRKEYCFQIGKRRSSRANS